MTLEERIRHVRLISGKLTMEAFASRIGVTASAISRFESGDTKPKTSTLKTICREFDISEDWLIRGEGDVTPKTFESELERLCTERHLSHEDYLLIRNYMDLPQTARNAVTQFMIGFAMDAVPLPNEPPLEGKNVHEWTPDEMAEEARRQAEEDEEARKRGTEEPSTFGRGNSGTA